MDYQDAIEYMASRTEAQREIEKHGASFAEFVADMGDRAEYAGDDVLGWLGY